MYTYIYIYVNIFVYVYIYIYKYTYCIYFYVCTRMTNLYVYIYIYNMYIYIYRYHPRNAETAHSLRRLHERVALGQVFELGAFTRFNRRRDVSQGHTAKHLWLQRTLKETEHVKQAELLVKRPKAIWPWAKIRIVPPVNIPIQPLK